MSDDALLAALLELNLQRRPSGADRAKDQVDDQEG